MTRCRGDCDYLEHERVVDFARQFDVDNIDDPTRHARLDQRRARLEKKQKEWLSEVAAYAKEHKMTEKAAEEALLQESLRKRKEKSEKAAKACEEKRRKAARLAARIRKWNGFGYAAVCEEALWQR